MAASLMGIMALVCMNINSSTPNNQLTPPSHHSPVEASSAAQAL